jgi:hypothetical protein
MQHFLVVRKAFLIATLVYACNFVLGTVVAVALNLSADPTLGSASNTWFASGTPLSAPGVFMIPYVIFLVLVTRQHWMGTVGVAGVTLLTLISGMASLADRDMVQRALTQQPAILTVVTLVVLFITIPTIVILGILTLIWQWRVRTRPALP